MFSAGNGRFHCKNGDFLEERCNFTSYSNPSSWPCPVIFSVIPALLTCAPFLSNSTMIPDGAFTITLVTKVFPLCSADGSVLPMRDNPLSGSDKNLS